MIDKTNATMYFLPFPCLEGQQNHKHQNEHEQLLNYYRLFVMNRNQFEQLCHQVAVSRLIDLQGFFYIRYSITVERRVQEMIGSVIEFMDKPSFSSNSFDALACNDHCIHSRNEQEQQKVAVTAQLPLGLQLDIPQLADEIIHMCKTPYTGSSALTQLPPPSLIKEGPDAAHKKMNNLVSCQISESTARDLILKSGQPLAVQARDRCSPERIYKFESTKRKRAKRVLLSSLKSHQGKWNIYKCYW